jgi:holo-[acyl-carrier protein] synthase
MVEGIGVDIIEIERVAEAVARRRFRERIFSDAERAYCEDGGSPRRVAERYAGRFAAKEAILKALGTGMRIPLREVETLRGESGAPYVRMSGEAAAQLDGRRVLVSISHCKLYAVAQAIVERVGEP